MEGRLEGDTVSVDPPARERYYDSRGYGRPRGDALDLAPVEAAHLLDRGDLDAVDKMDFRAFLTRTGTALPFVVYRDLRERGFYLTPAREGWVRAPEGADLVVYPRGQGPWGDEVLYRVRVLGERRPVAAADLGSVVLAVVDEDGDLTYFDTSRPKMAGTTVYDPPDIEGDLLVDRVLIWNPPPDLHDRGFYGQRLHGRDAESGPLQLSLVEAAYLHEQDALALDGDSVREQGRDVEGERFDRRVRAYAALRDRGVVPKSGFKFGADFRTYHEFESVESMGHSDRLVRVVTPDREFVPRDVSLDVRLSTGVRKEMVFALVGEDVEWLRVERLKP